MSDGSTWSDLGLTRLGCGRHLLHRTWSFEGECEDRRNQRFQRGFPFGEAPLDVLLSFEQPAIAMGIIPMRAHQSQRVVDHHRQVGGSWSDSDITDNVGSALVSLPSAVSYHEPIATDRFLGDGQIGFAVWPLNNHS